MADNKDKKVLKSSIERELSQTCLNSAEREKIKGSTNLNVPHLRFPEFRGEWEEHTLSEYLEFKNGLNPDAKRIGNGLPFISVMDVLSEGVIRYDNIRGKVDATEKEIECFGVKNGDILFQRSSETLEDVGRANVYMDDRTAIYGGFVIRGRKIGNYDPMFFKFLLATPLARKSTCRMGAGAQHFNIGQEGLSKILLFFPHIEEQRKIASLLSLIDQRIATQNKIIEDLKLLRDGISDAMFCTPKQSAPRQRIKGFYSDWQKVHLKDICSRVSQKNINGRCDLVLTIAAKYGLVSQLDFFNKSVASENLEGYYLLQKGDFAYNKSYSSEYTCGAVKRLERYEEGVLSPLYICFRPDPSKVNSDYLSYYFESTKWYREIMDISVEGARNHGLLNISVVDYFNTIHRIPNMDEQKCIANVIKAIMHKISSEQTILDCYIKQRIFLLRQMFI